MPAPPTSPAKSRRVPEPATPTRRKSRSHAGPRPSLPALNRLQGIRQLPKSLSADSIRTRLKDRLNTSYLPDEWQGELVSHVFAGYDAVVCAGTGYGKSLTFEALALLAKKGKVTIIICPLKALERDQAHQAAQKGLDTVILNEDTTKSDATLWKRARLSAQIVYMSPEMALSDSFGNLWADGKFRQRLTAIIVDEAHCIDDWGDDKFRPLYRKLNGLRAFTGQEVPIVACTATCSTSTFTALWSTLGFGNRPFWGVDVGCDRANLFFMTRPLEHPKNPLLEVLNFLPANIDSKTTIFDIDKGIIYLDSVAGCQALKNEIRKCLPPHLRDCVYAFSAMPSARAKDMVWKGFSDGQIRILVATDAAGMGCNVPDVVYTIVFGCSKTFSSVAQRWGRVGRDRVTAGVCILLVPPWAYPPSLPAVAPSLQRLRGPQKTPVESKADVAKRDRLDKPLLSFLALKQHEHCRHRFFSESFRPDTGLTVYDGFHSTVPTGSGSRASASPYQMTWITLPPDPTRTPPRERCCDLCNPTYAQKYCAADPKDPRLYRYAADFIYPAATPPSRSSSSLSVASDASQRSTSSYYRPHTAYQERGLPESEIQRFQTELEEQRELMWRAHGSSPFLSPDVFLPPKQLNALIKAAPKFAKQTTTNVKSVLAVIKLDFASEFDLMELARAISEWRESLPIIPRTPASQHRPSKKSRIGDDISNLFLPPTRPRLIQPVFSPLVSNTIVASSPLTPASIPRPRPRPNFKSSGGPQASSTPIPGSSHALGNSNPYSHLKQFTPQPRTPSRIPLSTSRGSIFPQSMSAIITSPMPVSTSTTVASLTPLSTPLNQNPYRHLTNSQFSATLPPPFRQK